MFGIHRCTPVSLAPTWLNAFISLTRTEAWYVLAPIVRAQPIFQLHHNLFHKTFVTLV